MRWRDRVNDADGDGVCDELEIDGCVVPTACNYNVNATNLVPCVYPEPGYTCDGECDGDADGMASATPTRLQVARTRRMQLQP